MSLPGRFLPAAFLVLWTLPAFGGEAQSAALQRSIVLPGDDAYLQDQPIQWWYWSGHLETADRRRFGFHLVFFGFRPNLQLAQAAIVDIDGQRYQHRSVVTMQVPKRLDGAFALASGKKARLRASGSGGRDALVISTQDYLLEIELDAIKPPAAHYDGQPYAFTPGGHTWYYSRTRMAVRGFLTVADKPLPVTGTAWFDRQFGDLEAVIAHGWQWFAIQLEDGTDISGYFFGRGTRSPDNLVFVTDPEGATRYISPGDYSLTVLDGWTSPRTGCRYPSKWLFDIEGETLEIAPALADQEMAGNNPASIMPRYWEGVAGVSGDRSGKAYVELHGFCGEDESGEE